jgi:hypothetical protein
MITAVALKLVEHFDEDSQNQVATCATTVIGLGIDIEEDDVGIGCDRSFDVSKEHGVFDFALEEFDRESLLATIGMLTITEQVRQNLQKVGFTASKESRDPNPHFARRIWVFALVDCLEIPVDELTKVLVKLFGDDEFIEFLPDGGVVKLIGFHDPVDGPEDVAFE